MPTENTIKDELLTRSKHKLRKVHIEDGKITAIFEPLIDEDVVHEVFLVTNEGRF